jgi:hypothetical protein
MHPTGSLIEAPRTERLPADCTPNGSDRRYNDQETHR